MASNPVVASDPSNPSTVFQDAYNQWGKQWYPVTADEKGLADNIGAAADKVASFVQVSASVAIEAQSIVNALNEAAALAGLLVFIPVVGTTIAAIGGTIAAVDAAKVQPAINKLAELIQQGFQADLDLRVLRNSVLDHGVGLQDAQNQLTQWGQNSVTTFWQALSDCVTALP